MKTSQAIEGQGGILVAHDGSAPATEALRVAIRWATALKTHLTVARTWTFSTAPRPATWERGYMPPLEDFGSATLEALVADVAPSRADNPDVDIVTTVVHGSPAEKLIEASSRFDLIVVGSRGYGGFSGLMLGSVSDQVVRHAECSVLVVKGVDGVDGVDPGSGIDQRERMEQALASELKLD